MAGNTLAQVGSLRITENNADELEKLITQLRREGNSHWRRN